SESIALPAAQRLVNEIVTGMGGTEVSQADFNTKYSGMNFNLILANVLKDQGMQPMGDDQVTAVSKREDEHQAKTLVEEDVTMTPAARQTVECVINSGIDTCVATSATTTRALASLDHVGLTPVIGRDHIYSGADMGKPKPLPDVYLKALREMGVPVDAVSIAVEDSRSGAKSATAAGITALFGMLGGDHITDDKRTAMKEALLSNGARFAISDLAQVLVAAHDSGIVKLSQKPG
ncbi:MAG: HAD family hydrolase, partial [Geminicoccaceae bacterium]